MKNVEENPIISNNTEIAKSYFSPIFLSTLVLILFSCSHEDPSPANPSVSPTAKSCKVQSQVVSGTGRESTTVTYTYDFLFVYTYDDKGNQTASNSTYKYKYSDGTMQTSSITVSSQFDTDNYLIRRISQYNATGKDGATKNSNTNIEYTYAEGRLSKARYNINDNGKVSDYSFSYEYNTEGKLVKYSSTYDNSYSKFEWNGNKVQKLTRVDQFGNTTSPFLEYNNDGLLIKSIDTRGGLSDEFRYQYDAKGQEIRFERYINTKPSSSYSSEYDTKENPFQQLYAKTKGDPTIPGTQSEYSPKNNQTKSSFYTGDPVTGAWKLNSTTLYTLDYNQKNLPVEVVAQNLDKDGVQVSTSRTTYQYQDCQ